MTRTERYELIVIGAGQAGLAVGYWLAKQDVDFLIVDANARVGDSWRKRWDSLRLFTPAKYSGLPGLRITGDPYHLPTRDEIADYLEWYSQVFELPIRHNVHVKQVTRSSTGFRIETDGIQLEADNVVVATGPFHVPRIPDASRQISGDIVQLHASEYRNPSQLPDGPVLVVGAANSGAQIALELVKTRDVLLAGRSVGSMSRRVFGRDVFDWLYLTVMRPGADSFIGRRIRKSVLGSTDALIGMTEKDLITAGVRRVGRIIAAENGTPRFADGSTAGVASIIWATGFRPNFSWIDAPIFGADGFPVHQRGVTAVPGLYFLGLRFQYRLNSSLIGGAGEDARFVAESIAARYGFTRTIQPRPFDQSASLPDAQPHHSLRATTMRILKTLKAIGVVAGVCLAVAILSGAAFERVSRDRVSKQFAPAGRLVDIGGRRVQIDCRGTGSPTVVFQSGLDIYGSLAWTSVHDSIARTTRACAYSRAGIMWSDQAKSFDVDSTAGDLHAALVNSGEAAPWIMVGHSLGGPYITTFTSRYPREVAGLVMVDASHPDQFARYEKVVGRSIAPPPFVPKLGAALSWTGLVRLMPQPPEPASWPEVMRHSPSAFLPLSIRGLAGEVAAVPVTLDRARRTTSLGDRPLVVLCAGNTASAEELAALKLTAAQGAGVYEAHQDLCRDMATWSTQGRLQVVERASHYVQIDRPDVVIRAVREVVGYVIAYDSAPRRR